MSRFKMFAVASAVVMLTSAAVQAAASHKPVHAMKHQTMRHGTMARGSAAGADNSADALNAQSLARSQTPAQ